MTTVYLLLALGFFAPVGWFAQIIRREELGLCQWRADRIAVEIARLSAPLPEARESLLPLPPVRQRPRVRPQWDTPTDQFWVIVANLADLDEPCAHCVAPEDGERPHLGCPGCSCPCSVVEVADMKTRSRRGAGLAPGDPRHGSENGYNWWRCRCEACREAHRVHTAQQRRRRAGAAA